VTRPIERLSAGDQRLLFTLIEMELEFDLRFERAAILACADTDHPDATWWHEAMGLIGPVIGEGHDELERISLGHYVATDGPTRLDATRAILRHLADWASLDEAGRRTAMGWVYGFNIARAVAPVLIAIGGRPGPFSASDLHPPLTGDLDRTQKILGILDEKGDVRDTGDRQEDEALYELVVPASAWAAAYAQAQLQVTTRRPR
jgi:hypothetical protein